MNAKQLTKALDSLRLRQEKATSEQEQYLLRMGLRLAEKGLFIDPTGMEPEEFIDLIVNSLVTAPEGWRKAQV